MHTSKLIIAVIIGFTLFPVASRNETMRSMTVLKKYKLRHPVGVEKVSGNEFYLMADASGFIRRYSLLRRENYNEGFTWVHDRSYLQMNDTLYGPYAGIEWVLRRDGRFAFIYSKKDSIATTVGSCGRGCVEEPAGCCIDILGLIFTGSMVRPSGPRYEDEPIYRTFVMINGTRFGPYNSVRDLSLSEDGGSYILCTKDGRMYAVHNGKAVKYEHERDVPKRAKGPDFVFWNFTDKRNYHNNHGYYGWYDARDGDKLLDDNGAAFGVFSVRGTQYFIKMGKREFGPYDADNRPLSFHSSLDESRHAFVYEKLPQRPVERKDPRFFIRYGKQEFGPYHAADFRFIEGDRAIALYVKDGYAYISEIQ